MPKYTSEVMVRTSSDPIYAPSEKDAFDIALYRLKMDIANGRRELGEYLIVISDGESAEPYFRRLAIIPMSVSRDDESGSAIALIQKPNTIE